LVTFKTTQVPTLSLLRRNKKPQEESPIKVMSNGIAPTSKESFTLPIQVLAVEFRLPFDFV